MAGIDDTNLPARAEVEFTLPKDEGFKQRQRIGSAVEFDDQHGTAGSLRGDGELDKIAQAIAARTTGGQRGDGLGLAMERLGIK